MTGATEVFLLGVTFVEIFRFFEDADVVGCYRITPSTTIARTS